MLAYRFTVGIQQSQTTALVSNLSHWLCYANSAVNPLIYNFMSGKYNYWIIKIIVFQKQFISLCSLKYIYLNLCLFIRNLQYINYQIEHLNFTITKSIIFKH
jgi:hypothetical protein